MTCIWPIWKDNEETFCVSLVSIYGVGLIDDRIRNVIAGRNDSSPKDNLIHNCKTDRQNKKIPAQTDRLLYLRWVLFIRSR